jgi:hypothetical protein
VNTVYGVESLGSGFDTVLSVYTGVCGSLTRIACNDDFGGGSRSLLVFTAQAGTTYLIEVSGKGNGGQLDLNLGLPTISGIQYTDGPDGKPALLISGAGFVNGNATVTLQKNGVDSGLTTLTFNPPTHGDGTVSQMFASRKKLKKLVKKREPVIVRIESPSGSGRLSEPFTFTR